MFRRCLSLLVIAGFLASQMALVPHAHGIVSANEQQKHDATPHIHCGWFGSSDHGHCHAHGDRCHGKHSHSDSGEQAVEVSQTAAGDEANPDLCIEQSHSDHDADAVFLSGLTVATSTKKVQVDSAWQVFWQCPLSCSLHQIQASTSPPLHWETPDVVQDASDSYLTLRNLRI